MEKSVKRLIGILYLLFIILFSSGSFAQELVFQFSEGFSSKLRGNYRREAVFQDSLLWMISQGKWDYPFAGSTGDRDQTGINGWEPVSANDKGDFRGRDLRGGYLFCEYESPRSMDLVLEINGHNEVYVNGEPRGGDVYSYGWVQHPIRVKRGKNSFLVRGSRGQVSLKLTKPSAKIFISDRDALMPDLVEGLNDKVYGAVRVINCGNRELKGYKISAVINGNQGNPSEVPVIMAYASRKVPFEITADGYSKGDIVKLTFSMISPGGKVIDIGESPEFELKCLGQYDRRKETFISNIDGSVQYYSLVPSSGESQTGQALFFSLHGASVEAVNQAAAYSPKDWGLLVAPTNRRPYGFDWEDWGRLDAREVLDIVTARYRPDPARLYLTGHSMGGHGTWQFGVTYPGYWAAIAPSAGWYSFWSYAGKEDKAEPDKMENIFVKASNPSNTLGLSKNYLHYGIYILHGDKDDNVPVSQARFMREHLGKYHPDFCYYERPGAGHWWGNQCVDWPPLFGFLENHLRPETREIVNIDFSTASPGISSTSRFVTIWQQESNLEISNVRLEQDTLAREIRLESSNVSLLKLDLGHLRVGQPYIIICGDDSLRVDPGEDPVLFLGKEDEHWRKTYQPSYDQKGPQRSGLFKEAFRNNMLFVYGTSGTTEENEWARNKARFDAETFWYRGNGSVDVISDREFMEIKTPGRNIILYGHSEMNRAWDSLLEDSPINVTRGSVVIGDDKYSGDDLAVCFLYPRPGEQNTSVAVIAGTGRPGLVAAIPNRYFVSGAGYPDFMVYRADMLIKGIKGVEASGFFDNKWMVNDIDCVIK